MEDLFKNVVEYLSDEWGVEDDDKELVQSFANTFDPNMYIEDARHYLESAIHIFIIG